MIIVIKEQASSDIITLSCVTSFDESYTGSVSSHPIESGSTITDHVTSDNDKFKVSGVVSDYDFLNPSKDLALGKEGYSDEDRSAATSRFTNGLLDSGLIDIPDKQRAEYIKRRLIDIRKNSLLVTILEYPDSGELVQHTDCILTSLSFKEDENSGYAVYPEMAFEHINVVQVKVEEVNTSKIPKLPDSKVTDAATGEAQKGAAANCVGVTYRNDKYTYDDNGTPRVGTLVISNGIGKFSYSFNTADGGVVSKSVDIPVDKIRLDKGQKLCELSEKTNGVVKKESVLESFTKMTAMNKEQEALINAEKLRVLRQSGK